MAEMPAHPLSSFSGEFRAPEREAAFQAERLTETLRHTRLIFLGSAILNTLFFISDWRFYGEPHFFVAIPARAVVVLIALACFRAIRRVVSFRQAQNAMIAWEWINGLAVAALVSSHSDLALFVVLMLPSIYYLAVPTSFRWSVISGAGCSALMLAGYLHSGQSGGTATGLILAIIMLNAALIFVTARANRLQRLEWCAKEELAESRTRFETMFRTVPIPLIVSHMDGAIAALNDAAISYLGKSLDPTISQKTGDFYRNPDDRKAFVAALQKNGRVSNFETELQLADGSIRTVLLAGTSLDIGGVEHIMAGVIDITERKASEERIWRAASHDTLTGLPNRAYFQSRLEQMLAQATRSGTGVSLILIDIDNLRAVNELLGHSAGDALIRHAASRLSLLMRSGDMVARLGGDEFVILVTGPSGMKNIEALADRILDELRRPLPYGEGILSSQASIGIASFPDHDGKPSDLMKDADLALQVAKAQGRNRAVIYRPEMKERIEQKATVTRDIQEALRLGQIVPFYQPKVDLKTGRVVGFEALARWRHPDHGLLTPAFFSTAFEDPDLSISVGDHMLRQVAADIKEWLDHGIDCGRIAINLSTAEFDWVGLANRVLAILETAGVPNERLAVEVTETVFLGRSAPHVVSALKEFHEHGVRIALDDFGTGYASLIHLKQFPIDDIKIDQSFVKDLENDAGSAAIVLAVIELGQNLGMDVIAEGIETNRQAVFLREKGCAQGQGNLYSRPMAANQVAQYLLRQQVQYA